MSNPDRRSFDSPRRGTRGRDRNDDFPPSRGRDEPYVPRDAFVPRGGDRAPPGFGAPRAAAPSGPETGAVVKWFNAEKGFGFVTPDGGSKDVFVHITALNRGGLSGLEPNQAVVLQVADGRRGPEAVNVELA